MQMAELNLSITLDALLAGAAGATQHQHMSPCSNAEHSHDCTKLRRTLFLVRPGALWSAHHEP